MTAEVNDDSFILRQFTSIMTYAEKMVLRNTLRDLTDALDAANITYYMCGGTLIGSYRHHGVVPWDDDIDIYVRWVDRFHVEAQILENLSDYVLVKASTRWKIYSRNQSTVIPDYDWNYPFVDVSFTVENNSLIWDYDDYYYGDFRYNVSTVFPLRRRPFMQLSLWAPNDVETYLNTTYDIRQCETNTYIHKSESSSWSNTIDCERLYPHFPFVFRSRVRKIRRRSWTTFFWNEVVDNTEVIIEELKINDRVLSCVALE